MAVITRFIVVRDGVALDQVFSDKKEAEAYDKMLDAAQNLAFLIGQADFKNGLDSKTIDEICVYLAKNAPAVSKILKSVKPFSSSTDVPDKIKTDQKDNRDDPKKSREPKRKSGGKEK